MMTDAAKSKSRRVLLGEITTVHGIRGEVVIRSYASSPDAFEAYGALEDESGAKRLVISVKRATPKGIVASVAGVGDRTAAEKFRGTKLYVARDKLPAAAQGEYYHADLIGLAACDPDGAQIGEVTAVHNFGAGDILELRLIGSNSTELVAFTDASVPEVDIAGGRLVVVMPSMIEGEDDTPEEFGP